MSTPDTTSISPGLDPDPAHTRGGAVPPFEPPASGEFGWFLDGHERGHQVLDLYDELATENRPDQVEAGDVARALMVDLMAHNEHQRASEVEGAGSYAVYEWLAGVKHTYTVQEADAAADGMLADDALLAYEPLGGLGGTPGEARQFGRRVFGAAITGAYGRAYANPNAPDAVNAHRLAVDVTDFLAARGVNVDDFYVDLITQAPTLNTELPAPTIEQKAMFAPGWEPDATGAQAVTWPLNTTGVKEAISAFQTMQGTTAMTQTATDVPAAPPLTGPSPAGSGVNTLGRYTAIGDHDAAGVFRPLAVVAGEVPWQTAGTNGDVRGKALWATSAQGAMDELTRRVTGEDVAASRVLLHMGIDRAEVATMDTRAGLQDVRFTTDDGGWNTWSEPADAEGNDPQVAHVLIEADNIDHAVTLMARIGEILPALAVKPLRDQYTHVRRLTWGVVTDPDDFSSGVHALSWGPGEGGVPDVHPITEFGKDWRITSDGETIRRDARSMQMGFEGAGRTVVGRGTTGHVLARASFAGHHQIIGDPVHGRWESLVPQTDAGAAHTFAVRTVRTVGTNPVPAVEAPAPGTPMGPVERGHHLLALYRDARGMDAQAPVGEVAQSLLVDLLASVNAHNDVDLAAGHTPEADTYAHVIAGAFSRFAEEAAVSIDENERVRVIADEDSPVYGHREPLDPGDTSGWTRGQWGQFAADQWAHLYDDPSGEEHAVHARDLASDVAHFLEHEDADPASLFLDTAARAHQLSVEVPPITGTQLGQVTDSVEADQYAILAAIQTSPAARAREEAQYEQAVAAEAAAEQQEAAMLDDALERAEADGIAAAEAQIAREQAEDDPLAMTGDEARWESIWGQDLTGRYVMIPHADSGAAVDHVVFVEGGFGARPDTAGTAVFGYVVTTGDEFRFARGMIGGLAPEHLIEEAKQTHMANVVIPEIDALAIEHVGPERWNALTEDGRRAVIAAVLAHPLRDTTASRLRFNTTATEIVAVKDFIVDAVGTQAAIAHAATAPIRELTDVTATVDAQIVPGVVASEDEMFGTQDSDLDPDYGIDVHAVIPGIIATTVPGSLPNRPDLAMSEMVRIAQPEPGVHSLRVGDNILELTNKWGAAGEPGQFGWQTYHLDADGIPEHMGAAGPISAAALEAKAQAWVDGQINAHLDAETGAFEGKGIIEMVRFDSPPAAQWRHTVVLGHPAHPDGAQLVTGPFDDVDQARSYANLRNLDPATMRVWLTGENGGVAYGFAATATGHSRWTTPGEYTPDQITLAATEGLTSVAGPATRRPAEPPTQVAPKADAGTVGDQARKFITAIMAADPDIAEQFAEFSGYYGTDEEDEVDQVVTAMRRYASLAPHGVPAAIAAEGFYLVREADAEGVVEAHNVQIPVPGTGLYVTDSLDVDEITMTKDAVGVDAAIGYATAMLNRLANIEAGAHQVSPAMAAMTDLVTSPEPATAAPDASSASVKKPGLHAQAPHSAEQAHGIDLVLRAAVADLAGRVGMDAIEGTPAELGWSCDEIESFARLLAVAGHTEQAVHVLRTHAQHDEPASIDGTTDRHEHLGYHHDTAAGGATLDPDTELNREAAQLIHNLPAPTAAGAATATAPVAGVKAGQVAGFTAEQRAVLDRAWEAFTESELDDLAAEGLYDEQEKATRQAALDAGQEAINQIMNAQAPAAAPGAGVDPEKVNVDVLADAMQRFEEDWQDALKDPNIISDYSETDIADAEERIEEGWASIEHLRDLTAPARDGEPGAALRAGQIAAYAPRTTGPGTKGMYGTDPVPVKASDITTEGFAHDTLEKFVQAVGIDLDDTPAARDSGEPDIAVDALAWSMREHGEESNTLVALVREAGAAAIEQYKAQVEMPTATADTGVQGPGAGQDAALPTPQGAVTSFDAVTERVEHAVRANPHAVLAVADAIVATGAEGTGGSGQVPTAQTWDDVSRALGRVASAAGLPVPEGQAGRDAYWPIAQAEYGTPDTEAGDLDDGRDDVDLEVDQEPDAGHALGLTGP